MTCIECKSCNCEPILTEEVEYGLIPCHPGLEIPSDEFEDEVTFWEPL